MKAVILSSGALVVQHKEQSWLFGAPEDIKHNLEQAGLEMPKVLFTTSLRAPGYGKLGPVLRYKEAPLRMNGLNAIPKYNTHGTDYIIESDDGDKILFSERGDVSADDTQGYALAVIKNKHQAKNYTENTVVWPWPDAEYSISGNQAVLLNSALKVWSSEEDIPDNLKSIDGAKLTLEQANFIARVAEGSGEKGKENWAIGISQFKKSYKKDGDSWVKQEPEAETAEKEVVEAEHAPIHENTFQVYKSEDGTTRWASVSSAATWDRQGELFTTDAMDWAIKFAKFTGYKGPLRYKHIPGLDGGVCDTQVRIGDFLFESGYFHDTPIGLAMAKKLKEEPERWQISLGLAFAKNDLVDGRYSRAAIIERTMTDRPALPVTALSGSFKELDMKIMTESELEQAAKELGMELTEVKMMYERAIAATNLFANKEDFVTQLKSAGMGAQTAAQDDGPEEDLELDREIKKVTKEDLVGILEDLTEEEWKELDGALEVVVKGDKGKKMSYSEEDMMDEEEDDEMEMEEEMPMKTKKKEDDRLDRLEALVFKQMESQNALLLALAGNNPTRQSVDEAVAGYMSSVPRQQAAQFVSGTQTRTKQQMNDEDIMAKLKAIEERLPGNAAGNVYDLFTSQSLNRK